MAKAPLAESALGRPEARTTQLRWRPHGLSLTDRPEREGPTLSRASLGPIYQTLPRRLRGRSGGGSGRMQVRRYPPGSHRPRFAHGSVVVLAVPGTALRWADPPRHQRFTSASDGAYTQS